MIYNAKQNIQFKKHCFTVQKVHTKCLSGTVQRTIVGQHLPLNPLVYATNLILVINLRVAVKIQNSVVNHSILVTFYRFLKILEVSTNHILPFKYNIILFLLFFVFLCLFSKKSFVHTLHGIKYRKCEKRLKPRLSRIHYIPS